ncbi:MAG: DUF1080 domain-containing protein [Williamsia sp.]|nr:DUF1080 domain-containing protein [Williamsia sp.]
MKRTLLLALLFSTGTSLLYAQQGAKHEDTEFYDPIPKVVTPGKTMSDPPSDAVVLFNGKDLSQWVLVSDSTKPADWTVANGLLTVKKSSGNIRTKQSFLDYQLHIEWRIPSSITGEGQARGNSGVFLASIGKGDAGYELQVMDSYNNKTYTNGQAGSIYKQAIPMVNPARPPGEWQSYDVIWTAPRFNDDGSLKSPARVTAIFNGVVVQNSFEPKGPTQYVGQPSYTNAKFGAAPIKLQAHGDPSEPISFRNIWVRPIQEIPLPTR